MELKLAPNEIETKLRQVKSTIQVLRQSGTERWKNIKSITKQQQKQQQQRTRILTESDGAAPVWTQRMETLFGPLNDQLRLIKCDNCGILTRETNSKVGVTHKLNCEMLRKSGLMGTSIISKKFGAQFSNHLESKSNKRASSEVSLDSMNMPIKKKKKTTIIDYTQPLVTATVTGSNNSSQQSIESNNLQHQHQHIFNGIPMTQKQIKKALAGAERLEREAERKEKKRLEEEARKAKKLSRAKGPVNVNEQCGVLVAPNNTPCARSLTCKTHSMGAKRSVPGRSAPYDVLLNEWQKKHNPNWGDRKVVTPRVGPGIEPGQSKKKKKESAGNGAGGNNRSSNKSNNNNNKNDQEGTHNNQDQSNPEDSNSKDNNNKDKSTNSNHQSKFNNSNSKPSGNNNSSNNLNGNHQSGSSNKKSSHLNGLKGETRLTSEKMSAVNQAKLLGEVDEDFYLIIPPSSKKNTAKQQKKLNNNDDKSVDNTSTTIVDGDGDAMMTNEKSKELNSAIVNNDQDDNNNNNNESSDELNQSDLELESVIKGLIISRNFNQLPLDHLHHHLHPKFDSNSNSSSFSHSSLINRDWAKFSKLGVKESFKNSLKFSS